MEMFKVFGIVCLTIVILMGYAECRQKCLTCQFQSALVSQYETAKNKECVTAPYNWTGGELRMRCPSVCTISARFDVATSLPTFFHRGCQASTRENGCIKTGVFWDCFYACEGDNYCNDATRFKIKEGEFNEEDDKKDDEDEKNNDKDDIASSLYALIGLIVVCAFGFYVKKNCCGDEEEEEGEDEEDGVVP